MNKWEEIKCSRPKPPVKWGHVAACVQESKVAVQFCVCMWAFFSFTKALCDLPPQVNDINRQQNGSDNPTAHRTLEGKNTLLRLTHECTYRKTFSFPVNVFGSSRCPYMFPDHRVRPGALPGQAHGVHRLLPEHHWVRDGQHPFPEGRVWRVSIPLPPSHFWLGNKRKSNSSFLMVFVLNIVPTVGWATSTPASVASSLSWRRETIPALRPTVAATPIALRGWSPSGPSAVLWASHTHTIAQHTHRVL